MEIQKGKAAGADVIPSAGAEKGVENEEGSVARHDLAHKQMDEGAVVELTTDNKNDGGGGYVESVIWPTWDHI